MNDNYINTIDSIESGSNRMISWSLSIVGGSLLVILSDSYYSPVCQTYRLAYFLFAIGWTLIGISIFNGRNISNSKMAAVLYNKKEDKLKNILENVNKFYSRQIKFFNYGLIAFAIWLLFYLFWWIFK